MDHGLELIIGILEILKIEVFIVPIILEILEIGVFQFLIYWKYLKSVFPISDMVEILAAGGRLQGLGSGGLGLFVGVCSWNFVTCPISGNSAFLSCGVIWGTDTDGDGDGDGGDDADNSPICPDPHHAQGPNIPFEDQSLTSINHRHRDMEELKFPKSVCLTG